MKTFLHVGCGHKRKEQTTRGFNTPEWTEIRLDIDEQVRPDVMGTMVDMSAVESESVDAIFSSHNIEHLYPHEVPLALAEFRRVLKPEGYLIVTCPALEAVCALVAEDKLLDEAYMSPAGSITPLDILYGLRSAMANGNLFMAHRCGFTKKTLMETLLAAQFQNVAAIRRDESFDLWGIATKDVVGGEGLQKLAEEHFL